MLSTISEMDPVLIAAAVIPAVILLLQVYRADRLEKEPTGLLISLLVFGVIATGARHRDRDDRREHPTLVL